jgi:NAD(P)H-dependent flavin oxidoreductase YrpB (nitropropane dioxygenase family)
VTGLSTAFTELVGCRLPLQQAGMGGVTTPALAAAVARAGGLGMLGGAGLSADEVIGHVRAAGMEGQLGVNFLVPFLDLAVLEAVAPAVRVVELFYGDPEAGVVDRIHQGGALAAWQVGSVDEARGAADAGCDLVVVQGNEAGGHVRGRQPLLPLLAEVRSIVDVPLVAAGGIGDGAAMATALEAGADAVRVGTRFLAAEEADVHPDYLSALVAAGAGDTELTESFALLWPDAPHRVLRSCIEASDDDPAVRSPHPPGRDFVGDVAAAALYAGTSVDHVHGSMSAADIVDELIRDVSA